MNDIFTKYQIERCPEILWIYLDHPVDIRAMQTLMFPIQQTIIHLLVCVPLFKQLDRGLTKTDDN